MNWFGGRLVIQTKTLGEISIPNLTLHEAQTVLDRYKEQFISALYYPYTTTMEPTP